MANKLHVLTTATSNSSKKGNSNNNNSNNGNKWATSSETFWKLFKPSRRDNRRRTAPERTDKSLVNSRASVCVCVCVRRQQAHKTQHDTKQAKRETTRHQQQKLKQQQQKLQQQQKQSSRSNEINKATKRQRLKRATGFGTGIRMWCCCCCQRQLLPRRICRSALLCSAVWTAVKIIEHTPVCATPPCPPRTV